MRRHVLLLLIPLFCAPAMQSVQAQSNDEAYGAKIKEYTTNPRFVNEMVDHLPYSETIPSPLDHFGTIIGAPGILHYTHEIYGYLRALAAASERVEVRTIGETEEGREMIEVIVADEATMQHLDTYRADLNRLADPRTLTDEEARQIIERAKPIYYITAGLHSPETGSPEMVMELAYRLAVEESPLIRAIRENVIFIFTPVAEADGRDRIVDTYTYRAANREVGPSLAYWGHYVAHDNNRDGYGLGLALTRNILASFLHWTPQVMHDLHESVSYLYTSTGLGPYNEYIDAITIDEWHNLAHEEVTELTRRDMPGVWTHAFYNGWAANYLIWIANLRNSTGRFYETFGNSIPDTKERKLTSRQTSRRWYRPNPPLEKAMWSLRNNTNYMQSGVLAALKYTADNRQEFVENFYLKSKRSVEKGRTEAPYAWVIPREQGRPLATVNLVNLLMQQGVEIHEATRELRWSTKKDTAQVASTNGHDDPDEAGTHTAPEGSFVIRLDQPYRTLVQVLLDKQNFPEGATPPYDDTGWTLPYLHQVRALKVNDPDILSARMRPVTEQVTGPGVLEGKGRAYYVLNNTTDDNVTVFRFTLDDVPMQAAEEPFEADGYRYNAGSFIITADGAPADLTDRLERAARDLGLTVRGVSALPDVPTHPVEVPRVALVHTWVSTPQDAGWWHLAFDAIGIPYTYLAEQDLATTDLSSFDVIILPRTRASSQTLVAGQSRVGDPVPWQQTDAYRHIGLVDQTDDMRKGMGYEGLINLKAFIEGGGVFITEGNTAAFPIDMALTRRISIQRTRSLSVRGSVLRAEVADKKSPIVYGYADTLGVYFSQSPVFQINKNVGSYRTPDWYKDEAWKQEVPRVVLKFAKKGLLMSGMLKGGNELGGKPAVVDVPVGEGHVVLFANRPFRRWSTQGSHALVFNTMLHWNDLRTGWPERPAEDRDNTPSNAGHDAEQFE
ncbi:MAG: M14 family zinc carboxypeptidase [Rhodothermales bacterium]